jgi:CoA:oxalate CoA-transferase
VVVENFVAGTMSRLGLGYEVLRKRNPRIIYAAISGFGQTGPEVKKPALDVTIQARGGIMSLTGEPGGPPIRPGASFGDIIAGLFACVGVLAALIERETSGKGQLVDISMLDCQLAVLENALERYFVTGEVPRALGTRHPIFTPFQVFETKDGYIALAITGQQWDLFCATMDHIELIDDPRFETGELRTKNYTSLEPILNPAMKTRTTREWLEEFEKVEIPCSPVNTIDKVAADPQILAREMIVEIFQPRVGRVKVINTPVKLSRTACRVDGVCPELGEHTEEVLTGLLGISKKDLEKLRQQQVI